MKRKTRELLDRKANQQTNSPMFKKVFIMNVILDQLFVGKSKRRNPKILSQYY